VKPFCLISDSLTNYPNRSPPPDPNRQAWTSGLALTACSIQTSDDSGLGARIDLDSTVADLGTQTSNTLLPRAPLPSSFGIGQFPETPDQDLHLFHILIITTSTKSGSQGISELPALQNTELPASTTEIHAPPLAMPEITITPL
jgi:hypothetical protein